MEDARPSQELGYGPASDLVNSWVSAARGRKIGLSDRTAISAAELAAEAVAEGRRVRLGPIFNQAVEIRCKFVEGAARDLEPALAALAAAGLMDLAASMGRREPLAHWAAGAGLARLLGEVAVLAPREMSRLDRRGRLPLEAGLMAGQATEMGAFLDALPSEGALRWAREARVALSQASGLEAELAKTAMLMEARAEARALREASGGAAASSSERRRL